MSALQDKIKKIQKNAPKWAQQTKRISEIEPLMKKLDSFLKLNNLNDVNKIANEILKLIESN